MTPQVRIETAAGSAQSSGVVFDGIAERADRIERGCARITPTVRLEPDGHRWMVRIGRFVQLHGETPIEVMALAAVVLGHDAVSPAVEVGR